MTVQIKELTKGALDRLGLLDYAVFLLEDRIKRFSAARLYRNLQYRVRGAPDGLPIPPDYLIWLVIGDADLQAFFDSGLIHAQDVIQFTLDRNHLAFEHFDAILDFGCGCGRIIRHWRHVEHAQLCGSDYNPTLIRWCSRHLPFARFVTNQLQPPLTFQDRQFDFVYARSVFTHLAEDLQSSWMNELWRVLKPGGYLLFTVSGDQFLGLLTPAESEAYQAGRLVVRAEEMQGKNYCAVYHPKDYVRQTLVGDRFGVVDFIPGDAGRPFCLQDTYLFRSK